MAHLSLKTKDSILEAIILKAWTALNKTSSPAGQRKIARQTVREIKELKRV